MALNAADSAAPYRQIAADLRRLILSGDLKPGDKLPSARELMKQYGVATQTVQSAFRVLRGEDLIYSVQGRGTFVHDDLNVAELPSDDPSSMYIDIVEQLGAISEAIKNLNDRVSEIESSRGSEAG